MRKSNRPRAQVEHRQANCAVCHKRGSEIVDIYAPKGESIPLCTGHFEQLGLSLLIIDNWSSHVSDDMTAFFRDLSPRIHVLFTPVDASWLNQAESLLEAFIERYLLRGSWSSRALMLQHILDSQVEYNQRFAHPFRWEWSCRDFSYWLNNTPGLIRCKTWAPGH